MQDAFAVEKGGIGSWMEIGYSAPGDNQNATSTTTTSGSYKTNNFVYYEGALGVWNAKAKTKLNDCLTTSDGWSLTPTYISTGANEGSVNYTTGTENVCTALTPSFKGLARALGGSGT